MASVRLQSYALVALALMAGTGVAHAQLVQIRGTFNGVPFPPTCAPPAAEAINFVLTAPPPSRLRAQFACDTVPSRPLRFTCLPSELGGTGTGVSALYGVRAAPGGVSELFVECPTDASTTVTNLEVAIQDLFVDRATFQSNPGANPSGSLCVSAGGDSVTRVSYAPDTRILSYDCLSGTTTSTVECFTWDGEPVSSTRSTSGLTYQVANRNILNVEDCIGFGANNDRALNSPALISPQVVGGEVLFVDSFEPSASVATTTTITAITPTPATIGEPYTVSVNVGGSGAQPRGAVLVSDAAGANCTVTLAGTGTGSCVLTSTAAGTRTIRATYAGRVGFDGSTVTATQTVGIGTQTITFSSPAEAASITYSPGGTVPLVATGGNSGLPVTFTTTTPATCGVSGNTLNIAAAGACVILANQAGNANYDPAPPVTRNVTIARANQTITFTQPGPGAQPFGATFQVAATGGGSGNPVVFVETTPSVCIVSGTTVTPQAIGTCTIRAQQAGSNPNYNAATPVLRDITISRGAGTLGFPAQGPFPLSGGNFTLAFTPGPSTAQVTFVSLTPNICTRVSGAVFTPVAVGVCVISGTHEEDAFYLASPTVKRDITIVP
jgi:hypothetical protein